MTIKNTKLLQVLQGQVVSPPPMWLMRQAGRYLPEYQKVRADAGSFMDLCQNPRLACEVTMQPIRRFDLDAAIIFSDILTIPHAMGMDLTFLEKQGPVFKQAINTQTDIDALQDSVAIAHLHYVAEAIALTKEALADAIPLIGFSGSPWTLATYMVEGQASKNFTRIKTMLLNQPAMLQQLLEKITAWVKAYASMQIAAGADVFMLFDTWGGILTTDDYLKYSLAYLQEIVQHIKAYHPTPVILFTKNGGQWLPHIATTGCDCIGLDWTYPLATAYQSIDKKIALQGNLDPAVLYGTPKVITERVRQLLAPINGKYPHIFNLGHGILPDVPPEHVQALVDAVRQK